MTRVGQKLALAFLPLAWGLLASAGGTAPVNDALITGDTLPATLSEFRLLMGKQGMRANQRVMPYSLTTPLFSDYAEKWRYLYLPKGTQLTWKGEGLPDFPVGAVLVKSFGYPADMRRPDDAIRMIETRLLLHRKSGWVALPYVWRPDGSDADLKRAGTRTEVRWTHTDGKEHIVDYAVPNTNQCKGCHDVSGTLTPIGPKARNLAGNPFGAMPAVARLPVWNDPKSGSLDARAHAYLDANCGHCHNPQGPASNSGLNLNWDEKNPVAKGIGKRPVAAGRASGGFDFDIAPGDPDQSIMIYRLESLDPGISMPELGRNAVHDEGVALLKHWIKQMPKTVPHKETGLSITSD